ncbi:helix-turn-helix domain-containing protein [Sphingomonas sp. CFBP8993]|uniref:helix-turn-helix domain-containing protein n=1 Tax=Sphingomonas sp. CFBP8993 TaxID=3096526 RepID=UPI002A69FFEB|nr:helix-turn-helix domain-containing protein [Sphingomonas sp. CFBP8993]MDY0960279.1 helix-turn-helix domain-containing protein [Sphingomonas sp. CFBP8993]
MKEEIRFSSDGLAEDEAFARYHRLYANGADVVRLDGPFRASVTGWRFRHMLLFDRHLSGMAHVREERVQADGFDHIVLHHVLSGSLTGGPRSGFERAGPGDIVFLDTRRGHRTEARDLHLITASVSRDLVLAAVGSLGALHGHVAQAPDTAMLSDFLQSLVRHAPTLDDRHDGAFARALIELLPTALGGPRDVAVEARRQDHLRREAVEQLIEREIANPNLTGAAIAEQVGVSRATLYRLYQRSDGIARHVRRRRIDAVRRALEGVEDRDLGELAQAYGLGDAAALVRAFQADQGIDPATYRARVRQGRGDPVETGTRRWNGWMQELD